jgi:hypothetical protein
VDLQGGEHLESIPGEDWAGEVKCSSIRNLWLVLLVELVWIEKARRAVTIEVTLGLRVMVKQNAFILLLNISKPIRY